MFLMLILDGGQNIIAAIYGKHYRRMLYVASNILGQARGEEALHDVFVKLVEKYQKKYFRIA